MVDTNIKAMPPRNRAPQEHVEQLDQLERTLRSTATSTARNVETSLDQLGKMSSEAVLKQYEAAAEAVEDMGRTVREMVKRLGEAMIECDTDMKHVIETAHAIREKGKHTEALIEQVAALSKAIRETCDDFQKKVTG
jgi:methyl-accepting chemotaxis protein